jgi:asparagine N-glycosylation enzyme membrane subunit Stt3
MYVAFLVALGVCLFFYRLKWMDYTIVALGAGSLAMGVVELWAKWCRRLARPFLTFLGGLVFAAAISLALAARMLPGLRQSAKSIALLLIPSLFGASGAINELDPLLYAQGHFTIMPALHQYYGAYFLALIGLSVVAVTALRRADPGRALMFFWGAATFVLAMGQLRMTYYYATAVALLSGYAADVLLASGRKTAWAIAFCLAIFVFAPNLYDTLTGDPAASNGIPPDWQETLSWLRASTPEPFGDPGFFYARYRREQFGPSYRYPRSAYSVLAWWDYGYWIEDVARRIPLTNPGQMNAKVAADIFLSQSEAEALPLLQRWRTRYVVVDARLPLWPSTGNQAIGSFPAFFEYSPAHRRDAYITVAYELNGEGKPAPKLFYLPAYYRSLVVRLFVFGGQAVEASDGATILLLWPRMSADGRSYLEAEKTQQFESAKEALAAEAACRNEGCVLASDDPMVSCVPLEALRQFRPLFSSTTPVIGIGKAARKEVQVYEFTSGRGNGS